VTFISVSSY